jgi:hypothetical protein
LKEVTPEDKMPAEETWPMPIVDVNDTTFRMLNELTASTHVPFQDVLNRAVTEFRRQTLQRESPLAPDGLAWPEGYFDNPPKMTLEEATAEYGVRPTIYFKGWPAYTTAETQRPEFKCRMPEEAPELEAQWEAEIVAWENAQNAPRSPAAS